MSSGDPEYLAEKSLRCVSSPVIRGTRPIGKVFGIPAFVESGTRSPQISRGTGNRAVFPLAAGREWKGDCADSHREIGDFSEEKFGNSGITVVESDGYFTPSVGSRGPFVPAEDSCLVGVSAATSMLVVLAIVFTVDRFMNVNGADSPRAFLSVH